MVLVLRTVGDGGCCSSAPFALAAAVAAPVIAAVWGGDAAYWATPARLGEILVGVLVAVVLTAGGRDMCYPGRSPGSLSAGSASSPGRR